MNACYQHGRNYLSVPRGSVISLSLPLCDAHVIGILLRSSINTPPASAGATLLRYDVPVALTVAAVGLSMTGLEGRLVKRNYMATRITLAEEEGRGSGPAGESKKRKYL